MPSRLAKGFLCSADRSAPDEARWAFERRACSNDGLGVLISMTNGPPYLLSSRRRDIVLKFLVVTETLSPRSKKLLLNFESLCLVAYSV